jgi:O-antigen/teichoic acid export membrane protein
VDGDIMRRAFRYGIHTFGAATSGRILEQGSPVIIGHFSPATFVGYFNFPVRLLAYLAEPLSRVGFAVQPRVTELITQNKGRAVAELGMFVNRYCFALFVPFGTFLPVYGGELLRVWMGPEFQNQSTALLVPMMVATGIAVAGQYSSTSILFGLARHQWYAYSQMMEAALLVALTIWVVPRYGILGAAWVSSALMLVFRGFFTPWLVCHYLDYPVMSYLRSIFLAPILTAIPVYFLLRGLKIYLPGSNWPQLILAGVVASVAYLGAAYFTSLERNHRKEVWRLVGKFAGRLRKAS